LTGHLTPGTDDYFRLSKFFLEILAGVTNTDIVVDPNGYIAPGDKLRIPFVMNEADIDATVLVMDDLPVIRFAVETPDGDVIGPGDVAHSAPCSVVDQSCAPATAARRSEPGAAGTWRMLQVDNRLFKKVLGTGQRSRGLRSLSARRATASTSTRSRISASRPP
jgi:hypothetical protein